MAAENPVEKNWVKPRFSYTADLWYDDAMPRLPKWTRKDVAAFTVAHPKEGEQLSWLRWRHNVTVLTLTHTHSHS
jgi:hypothetical protein